MSKYNLLFPTKREQLGIASINDVARAIEIAGAARRNYVITREHGDIPDCVPAVDVLKPIDFDVMRISTGLRAEKFCQLLQECGGTPEFRNHPFHMSDIEMGGIKNPCTPYVDPYGLASG